VSAAPALVLANGAQGRAARSMQALSTLDTPVIAGMIVAMALAAVLIALHLRRRARRPVPVEDEWRALAVMGELCPHGWEAQITLRGWGAPVPDDAPPSRTPLVGLEWKQFDEESERVIVARRVWAHSIGEALDLMVVDRRTDIELERIEQMAPRSDHDD
jgi:hypothetical protein